MKTFKNNLILFLVMLVIGLIGFNIFNEQFGSGAAAIDEPATTSSVSNSLGSPAVNVSGSSNTKLADSQVEVSDPETQSVELMLKNREDAWNTRDLNRYMADYRKFDLLRVSVDGKTNKGWEAVRDYFVSRFGPGMGTLRINNVKINMVGDYASIVTADWNLQKDNMIINGQMNLVMNKVDAAWKVTTENITEN